MKELYDELKNEFAVILGLFIVFAVALKIIYFKEDILTVLRTDLAIFWLFIVPGYAVMLNWKKNFGLAERMVVGSALSAGLVGILSYYVGIAGINISLHWFLVPLILISVGIGWSFVSDRKKQNEALA